MMETFPAAVDEASDHPVRRKGLQEFEADGAGPKEGDPDALGRDLLDGFRLEAEGAIAAEGRVEIPHRDPDVVGGTDHTSCLGR